MESRRIILGGVVLFLIIAGVLLFFRSKLLNKNLVLAPSPTPTPNSKLESRFNLVTTSTATKINLSAVNGEGEGLASREYKNSIYTQALVVNLPALKDGEFYEAWIVKGNEGGSDYALLTLGKLTEEKGGFILDYESKVDYSDYKKVVVTREKTNDSKMETKVLEGTFN